MANRRDADRVPIVGQLVEDPVSTDAQRVQPAQLSPQRTARFWLALEQAEGILDRIDQRPVKLEQPATSPAGEDEPRQLLRGRPAFGELAA